MRDYDSLDFHTTIGTPPCDLPDGNNDCTCDVCGFTADPEEYDFYTRNGQTICKRCLEEFITIQVVREYIESEELHSEWADFRSSNAKLAFREEGLSLYNNDYDRAMYFRAYENCCREFITGNIDEFAEWILKNKM